MKGETSTTVLLGCLDPGAASQVVSTAPGGGNLLGLLIGASLHPSVCIRPVPGSQSVRNDWPRVGSGWYWHYAEHFVCLLPV